MIGLTIFLLIAGIVLLKYAEKLKWKDSEGSLDLSKLGRVVAILLLIGAALTLNPFVIITAGQRGVVMDWGAVSSKEMGEGLNMRIPVMQSVQPIDVQIQKEEVQAGAASKDLQVVQTVVALNYFVDPERAAELYQRIGLDFRRRIIDPAIQEAVKAATSKYTAEELITKRPLVREDIKMLLKERLSRDDLMLDEISIKDFDFSPEFNKAIEAKVTAEQEALQAKNKLEQKKYEAEQIVVTAKADAESIRVQAESIAKQGGESYVQLKAIEKWDGHLPTQMIPGGAVPFLDLNTKKVSD